MLVLVAKHRKKLRMTQAELARSAGVGQHTISDIESGRHIPRVDVAVLVSRALGRRVEDLFLVEPNERRLIDK